MAISNSNTATSGEALLANMGTETESAGASLCAGFSTLLIGELPLGEFLSDSVILRALNVIPVPRNSCYITEM